MQENPDTRAILKIYRKLAPSSKYETTPSICVDGAFKNGLGAMGGILLNSWNMVLWWGINFRTCSSLEYVEARVAWEEIIKALQNQLQIVNIYLNSLQIIQQLHVGGYNRVDWRLILDEVLHMCANLVLSFVKVNKRTNVVPILIILLSTKSSTVWWDRHRHSQFDRIVGS